MFVEYLPVERVGLKMDLAVAIQKGLEVYLDKFICLMLLTINLVYHTMGFVDNLSVCLVVLVKGLEELGVMAATLSQSTLSLLILLTS